MRTISILTACIFVSFMAGAQQKGYYRSPAIYKNTVVFTAEGDLWKFDLGHGAFVATDDP